MFQNDRVDIFEGKDFNKTCDSHECRVFHDLYSFKISFRLQPCVYDDCHGLLVKLMRIDSMAIITAKRNYKGYRIHFWHSTKTQAVRRMTNADLGDKSGKR